MDAISNYLAPDHQRCDDFFYQAEAAALGGDWDEAAARFAQFLAAMSHHFAMEEDVLFPAFEQHTGNTSGPPRIMRMEHSQMRELFDALRQALAAHDAKAYAGASETLLVLMQQHNLKEEQMLYRMCDQMLAQDSAELIERMNQVLH
jgi:hemerythrin-like domain-containing protein